jgi:hypothetical protein
MPRRSGLTPVFCESPRTVNVRNASAANQLNRRGGSTAQVEARVFSRGVRRIARPSCLVRRDPVRSGSSRTLLSGASRRAKRRRGKRHEVPPTTRQVEDGDRPTSRSGLGAAEFLADAVDEQLDAAAHGGGRRAVMQDRAGAVVFSASGKLRQSGSRATPASRIRFGARTRGIGDARRGGGARPAITL